jgi:hypothetical protein
MTDRRMASLSAIIAAAWAIAARHGGYPETTPPPEEATNAMGNVL